MKFRLLTSLILGLTISCNQTTESNQEIKSSDTSNTEAIEQLEDRDTAQQKDSLTIVNSDFTTNPFELGENPLDKLISVENVKTAYKTYKNRHVENQIDTVFQIKIEGDYFEVYKSASENWLIEAKVLTENFQTRQGVKVGMTKSEVKEQLNLTSIEKLPDHLRLQNREVLEWFDLQFKNDRLETIKFNGYVD